MRLFATLLLVAAALSLAVPAATGADDAIGRLMQSQDASKLPSAPPRPLPPQVPGPGVGARPQGPLPVVMSARIGEHEDRTRLVIELSDPVNLRAFALANP
ncbi:MAG TPA: hypothetical protein VG501_04340, partial [Rhizomicrobium sp.]|nr:hypothetical protein [Rhizomicrobium sp.]